MQSIHSQKCVSIATCGQFETSTMSLEKNLAGLTRQAVSCILYVKTELCAQSLPTLGQVEGKEKDQKPQSSSCSLGKQQSQHVHRRTSNSLCSAGKWYILLFSPHSAVDADNELQFSPELESPSPWGRATNTLLFAQACAERTAWSL